MVSVINVKDLAMVYKVPVREAGLQAAFASLFRRTYREIHAVQGILFALEAGEVVGFIGPNGAGKTTTLKILSGILHPTGGSVSVLGFTPWRREPAFLKNIALIRGSQPIGGPGELTVLDSLRFQQLIYEVPEATFQQNLTRLADMLHLEALLGRQIRTLSLGERMRCGLALSLIYQPRVLFLDEPTLGLDVIAVSMMRRFISDYSSQTGATVIAWASRVLIAIVSLWAPSIELDVLYSALWQFGRYPVQIYRQPLRFFLTYVLPFAFLATFPTMALMGRSGLLLSLLGIVAGFIAVVFVQGVWRVSLRRYTSATS